MNVVWTPQPRQALFQARMEDEALYGGAAGGGKSDCALTEALRQVDIPHYRGLILRKTYPQLSELIDRSQELYPRAIRGAKYNDQKHTWRFPSGAKVIFGSMQHPQDRTNYQGKRYDYICFDELTHFTWEEYSYLFSRNRPNGPGTRCYMRATANPGGIGHAWVKARFITPVPPMQTIWDKVKVRFPDGKEETRWKSRVFIPSTIFDNKILLENDPDYLTRLASLPDADRRALLYGDWDSFTGQVFCEWRNDPEHYADRINTHVIKPFRVPREWSIWCGLDWGFARPFSVGWYAVDHDKRIYRIREYYGCTGTPNEGIKLDPSTVAREIRRIEDEDPNLKGRTIHRVGDPAIWASQGTESTGALMEKERVFFEKGDNTRLSGKMQVHHRLRFDENGIPMLYIFSTCENFIRTVPSLVYSQSNVEDVDTNGEDHIYDELRYVCMRNPVAPPKVEPPAPKPYDPLSTDDAPMDRYAFYRIYE